MERVPQSMDEPVQGAEGDLGAFGELLVDPLAGDSAIRRRRRSGSSGVLNQ